MVNLVLTKESSESEIKQYFSKVLELSQSGNEFPINLDEVWPLVYERKAAAIKSILRSDLFMQDVDYQILPINRQNSCAALRKDSIHLYCVLKKNAISLQRSTYSEAGKFLLKTTGALCLIVRRCNNILRHHRNPVGRINTLSNCLRYVEQRVSAWLPLLYSHAIIA